MKVRGARTTVRLAASAAVGLVVGLAIGVPTSWRYGLLAGWMSGAVMFLIWAWAVIAPMDADATAAHAVQEEPGRRSAEATVLGAAAASLIAVGLLLVHPDAGVVQVVAAGLSVATVLLAWGTVHTIYTFRYAFLYYSGPDGGVDFNSADRPRYVDFAYLAFTIGMTFQVSDTDLRNGDFRAVALRHALFSYLLGAVVLATTINLVAGLAK